MLAEEPSRRPYRRRPASRRPARTGVAPPAAAPARTRVPYDHTMRIDEISHSRRARLLVRVLPAEDGGGEEEPACGARRAARPGAAFVSVTYGAGGSTRGKTIEIVKRIREQYGLEAMAHFTCVGATVEELRATLDEMQGAGIDNVLALRGDPPAGQEEWRKTDGGLEYSANWWN